MAWFLLVAYESQKQTDVSNGWAALLFCQEKRMAGTPNKHQTKQSGTESSWGKKLFFGVLIAILAFFYWLLIYSGGVTVHHG